MSVLGGELAQLAWQYGVDYGSGPVVAGLILAWIKARPHLPHHHDHYVSFNGVVWTCTVCGKPPRQVDQQLAEVRAYIREHNWAGPYMGPDRANYAPTRDLTPKHEGIPL